MDYQFFHNILGQPMATCELTCEAFGDWLSCDIAQDFAQTQLLLDIIHQLQSNQLANYQHNGKEYHLKLDKDEVELRLNNHHIQDITPTEYDAVHELNEVHVHSGCGLTDFQRLLESWRQFIHKPDQLV